MFKEMQRGVTVSSKLAENHMLSQAIRLLSRIDDLRQVGFELGDVFDWEPPLDLIETQSEVVAYVALPGVDMSDVKISVENGVLALWGQRHRPAEWRDAGILRLELPWGAFGRRVKVPDGCSFVKQSVVQGYLVIHLKKPVLEI